MYVRRPDACRTLADAVVLFIPESSGYAVGRSLAGDLRSLMSAESIIERGCGLTAE
jgi:hypothetical protein